MSVRSDPQGYYQALGVPHTATADEIRLAFRARALESHPDQAGGQGDGETFRLIREAYEVLRDPRRRMAYDASGLAAWEHAPAHGGGWSDPHEGRRHGGGTGGSGTGGGGTGGGMGNGMGRGGTGGGRTADPRAGRRSEPGFGPDPAGPGIGAEAGPANGRGTGPGPEPGFAGGFDKSFTRGGFAGEGFTTAAGAGQRPRRRKAARNGGSRLWPLAALGLALLLLIALGSLWSAHRQLDDRQGVVAELYGRLSQLGAEQAELRARYRSIAFLDLERALRLGGGSMAPVGATTARSVDRFDIDFPDGGLTLDPRGAETLAQAVIAIAGQLDRLPPASEWLIVLEAEAARATLADQVAVESWEPALLRLATVLDELLAQGLPGERLAVRFNAGFAPSPAPAEPAPMGEMPPFGEGVPGRFDRVSIQLLCCVD